MSVKKKLARKKTKRFTRKSNETNPVITEEVPEEVKLLYMRRAVRDLLREHVRSLQTSKEAIVSVEIWRDILGQLDHGFIVSVRKNALAEKSRWGLLLEEEKEKILRTRRNHKNVL